MYSNPSHEAYALGQPVRVWIEKTFSAVSKILIAVLTYMGVQLTDKINTASMQVIQLQYDVKANQELTNQRFDLIHKDIDRLYQSVEKINDKMK